MDESQCLLLEGKSYVPENYRDRVLYEFHNSRCTVHPGTAKMYHDLQRQFRWPRMKRDVAGYVSTCMTCQRIKAEHQRPGGEIVPLEIPKWKWDHITMDFVTGLPRTAQGHDAIWVIVDRFTKSAHFLPIRGTDTTD